VIVCNLLLNLGNSKGTSKGNVSVYDLFLEKRIGHYFADNREGGEVSEVHKSFSALRISDDHQTMVLGAFDGSISILKFIE